MPEKKLGQSERTSCQNYIRSGQALSGNLNELGTIMIRRSSVSHLVCLTKMNDLLGHDESPGRKSGKTRDNPQWLDCLQFCGYVCGKFMEKICLKAP